MKIYTFNDWLEGEGQVIAEQENFNSKEWGLVNNKQKEIYNEFLELTFSNMIDEFEDKYNNSIDADNFLKSGIETLEYLFDSSPKERTIIQNPGRTTYYTGINHVELVSNLFNINDRDINIIYRRILGGYKSVHFIFYPDLTNPEKVDRRLAREVYIAALYKLFIHVRSKFRDVLEKSSKFQYEKLKWLGTPSQLGYIFLQLAEKGFIKFPESGSLPNQSKFARICLEIFEIKTTHENLKREFSRFNTLTEPNRKEFVIPDISVISKTKKGSLHS